MAVDMSAALSADLSCSSVSGGVIGSCRIDSHTGGIEVGSDGEIGVSSCGFPKLDMRDILGRSSIAAVE